MSNLKELVNNTNDLDVLNELHIQIQEKIEIIKKEELILAQKTVKDMADRLGVDPQSLITATTAKKGSSSKKGTIVEPTHQNPDDLTETWAGRGKHPRWLREKIENGAKVEDFKISK